IIHKSVEEVQPPPQLDGHREGFLTAVTRHEGRLVEIIDVEHVLAQVAGPAPEVSTEDIGRLKAELKGPHTVLVADDSRVARAQIVRTLEALGLETLVVNDGRAALRALQAASAQARVEQTFSLVISDIEMPDMDGYRLTTEIRKDPRLAKLPVILHTSLSGMFNQALVQRVGADRFVPKFRPEDLAQAVVETLAQAAEAGGTPLASAGSAS
ncbi:MAG: response regulator, partial [Oceanococcaceae bacterium]